MNKNFSGKLNVDDDPSRLPAADYTDAQNITRDAQGTGQDRVVSTIVGNILVPYTLPAGTNKRIGSKSDIERNRVYYFVWNSAGKHSILYYNRNLNTVVKVMENLTDTGNVDVLKFDPSYRINHIDIVYQDPLKGDLLYWTDALNRPSMINVLTATTGGYGTILRTFLDVHKEPPVVMPYVVYENDATVTVNNLRKKLFKFKYRWQFDNNEYSVYSAVSELPLPVGYLDASTGDQDPTKNCRIAVVFQTGPKNVKKIEIVACQSQGTGDNLFTDFFLIKTFTKATDGLADNDISAYRFYNDQAYITTVKAESIQPFDLVPPKAKAQALVNGNVLVYGGITEGLDIVPVSGSTSSLSMPQQTTQAPFILVGSQGGNLHFGSGNIHLMALGNFSAGSDVFTVQTTTKTVTFTSIVGSTSADIITGLRTAALTAGFTAVTNDTENLVITLSGESLVRITVAPALRAPTDSYAFDWSDRRIVALQYFDEKGVTNSSLTTSGFTVQTIPYTESTGVPQMPRIQLSITHRPPLWARYFHVLLSKSLAKSKQLYWVSERTFKDTDYGYIGIESLNTFKKDNIYSPLSYTFNQGDRIRFIKSLSNGSSTLYTNQDFEIVGQLTDPVLNGIQQTGQFVKIALPTTSGTFDFGTTAFYNYLVELYSPAQSVAGGLDVYYEIGERYGIGNAGTNTAYHEGMLQNQSSDLVTPATFEIKKGDQYYRTRTINTGVEMDYLITSGERGDPDSSVGVQFVSQTYNDTNVLHGNSPLQNLASWAYNTDDTRWIVKVNTGIYTFRIKGTIEITFSDFPEQFKWYLQDNTGKTTLLAQQDCIKGLNTIQFDTYFQLSSGQKVFFLAQSPYGNHNSKTYAQTTFTITLQSKFSFGAVDPNFSDYYPSAVNSLGRPWTQDLTAAQTYYPDIVRFGQEFQDNTTINGLNRFYADDQDSYDRSNGDIMKLFVDGRYLYVFHKYNVGVVPVGSQIIKENNGTGQIVLSDKLLNPITYPYEGQFGIGDAPESFAHGKWAKYFVDTNKGVVCRLSQDGIIVLSVMYKTNAFFISQLSNCSKSLNNGIAATGQVYSGDPTIYGCFDQYTNKYILSLEAINRYSDPNTLIFSQNPSTWCFLETRDESEGFEARYTLYPEGMNSLNNLLVSFKNGQIWTHNGPAFCNFYGTQYEAYIDVVFNEFPLSKKSWQAMVQKASVIWDSPSISTSQMSFGTTPQQSNLVDSDYEQIEELYQASLMGDSNSPGGVADGDVLKGTWMKVRFRLNTTKASGLCVLNMVAVKILDSPLNAK